MGHLGGLTPPCIERQNHPERVHLQGCDGGHGICRGWHSHPSLLGFFFCCLKHPFSRIGAGASLSLAWCPHIQHRDRSSIPVKRRGGRGVSGQATAGAAAMIHLLVANMEQIIEVYLGCLLLTSLRVLPPEPFSLSKDEAVYPTTCFSADLASQVFQCFEATSQCLRVPDVTAKPAF